MSKLADLLKEVRDMKTSVEKVENIVERRLVGVEEPLKDELRASSQYDKLRREGKAEYVTLKEVLKSLGVHRPSRKESR